MSRDNGTKSSLKNRLWEALLRKSEESVSFGFDIPAYLSSVVKNGMTSQKILDYWNIPRNSRISRDEYTETSRVLKDELIEQFIENFTVRKGNIQCKSKS